MLDQLLALFPQNTHPLVLVSDPDGLLSDEAILAKLAERGFQIIQEAEPVLLRYRVEQVKPYNVERPVLIVTDGALEDLPFDLWQQGQHVKIALHEFFPNLAYPILRALTSIQRVRLIQIPQPKERLGEQRTIHFLLENVFAFNTNLIQQPAYFVLWLDEFHQSNAPFPQVILEHVLEQLYKSSEYKAWPLKEILQDRGAYRNFIQDQWQGFLSMQTGKYLGEKNAEYLLHFETSQGLQDALPRLLRNGNLTRVQVETRTPMPVWVVPGIFMLDEDPRPRRKTELVAVLNEALSTLTPESRWEEWKAMAYQWAELTNLHNDLGLPSLEDKDHYKEIRSRLDTSAMSWLQQKYSLLAAQKLPTPHHVHHIPHYLNYLRSQGKVKKVALLIMDGMSLSDWLLVKEAWQRRQKDWQYKENLLLAQVPTITAVSRLSLISGLRPSDFYIPNATKLTETKSWNAFWSREGLPENTISLLALNLEKTDPTPEITNPRLQALCLIERQIDDIMHGAMLGEANHQSSVNLWLSQNNLGKSSNKLENIINVLLDERFTVFIASDHGHCEAYGIGKPSEGLMVQSRGRRARLYQDYLTAEHIQATYNNTILWKEDGLLPKDLYAVLPAGRQAFADFGEIWVTHGGPTIDEIVVPLIEINRK